MNYYNCVACCHKEAAKRVAHPQKVRNSSAKMVFPIFSTHCLAPYSPTEFRNERTIPLLSLMARYVD